MTLARKIAWVDPLRAFARLAVQPGALLLDSSLVNESTARWTFIAFDPFARLSAKAGQTVWLDDEPLGLDPFETLREVLTRYAVDPSGATSRQQVNCASLPPFRGGVAGFWGYDLGRTIEHIRAGTREDPPLPDLVVGLYDAVVAFDHLERCAWVISTGLPAPSGLQREYRAAERAATIQAWVSAPSLIPPPPQRPWAAAATPRIAQARFSREAYETAVSRAIAYIHAGDVFQVNLSQRFDVDLLGEAPYDVYCRLRTVNPAPFSAYFHAGSHVLVSSSPERFLKLSNARVETRPIKGTRPRGRTAVEDERLAQELLRSAKDRAENVMIVDLLRNDLSKVCCDHSVKIEQLCELERYATVQHLVSTVVGQLRPDQAVPTLLRACFPGGSVTGAPKVRAMEIIEELEPTRRGPYCGAIGYIGFDGAMDTSVAIRLITCAQGRAFFQVGGGIVADSDPHREYQETLTKGRAQALALGIELEHAQPMAREVS